MGKTLFSTEAYNILKEEEKTALNLQLIGGKSSWDAGQILRKSHYKYLEIKARAQKFLEIFTIHYNTFGKLIPDGVEINPSVKQYLEGVIEKRLKISEAIKYIDNRSFIATGLRNRYIKTDLLNLKSSKNASAVALYHLILDFDKYNNFRILPKELQEPSAFKRRNKNIHKKHVQSMLKAGAEDAEYINKQFGARNNTKKVLHTYIIHSVNTQEYELIEVKDTKEAREYFKSKKLYLFKNGKKASEFCRLIIEFYSKDSRHCTDGQKFWPLYRDYIKYAINYREINNLDSDRRQEWVHEDYDKRRLPTAKKEFGKENPID